MPHNGKNYSARQGGADKEMAIVSGGQRGDQAERLTGSLAARWPGSKTGGHADTLTGGRTGRSKAGASIVCGQAGGLTGGR